MPNNGSIVWVCWQSCQSNFMSPGVSCGLNRLKFRTSVKFFWVLKFRHATSQSSMSLSGSCCSKKRKRRRKTWNETKTTIWESEDWTYFLSYFQCFNRKTEIRPELIVFKWIWHVFETCGWSFDVSEGFWRIDDGLEGLRRGRSLVAATPEVFDVPLLRRPRAMR